MCLLFNISVFKEMYSFFQQPSCHMTQWHEILIWYLESLGNNTWKLLKRGKISIKTTTSSNLTVPLLQWAGRPPYLWVSQHPPCVWSKSECTAAPRVSPNPLHDHPFWLTLRQCFQVLCCNIPINFRRKVTLISGIFVQNLQSHFDIFYKTLNTYDINLDSVHVGRLICSVLVLPVDKCKEQKREILLGLMHLTFWFIWRCL